MMRCAARTLRSIVFMLLIALNIVPALAAESPSLFALSNAPGWVTLNYGHNGADNVDYFFLKREGVAAPIYSSPEANGQYFDTGLTPDTLYIYQACAVYGATTLCSRPHAVRTMRAPGAAARMDPPFVTDFAITPTSITVSWSPTGDYTQLLIHLSDELGNVDQRQLGRPPHTTGAIEFPGLRSGARYRIIFKGCPGIHIGDGGCGPWSADAFFTTSPPPLTPPDTYAPPSLTATYDDSTVSLAFREYVGVAMNGMHFQLFRDGTLVTDTGGIFGAGFFSNTHVDTSPLPNIVRKYWVCFLTPPAVKVCSDIVRTGHVTIQMGPPPIVVAP